MSSSFGAVISPDIFSRHPPLFCLPIQLNTPRCKSTSSPKASKTLPPRSSPTIRTSLAKGPARARLILPFSVEYNSAINLYLEVRTPHHHTSPPLTFIPQPQAHFCSALVKTHGASRIKKLVALEKLFVRKRQLRRDIKKSGKGGIEGWDEACVYLSLPLGSLSS